MPAATTLERRTLLSLIGAGIVGMMGMPSLAAADDELAGRTLDFDWDGKDIGRPELAYSGRAYVPVAAKEAGEPLPLLVFLHGLNAALIPHRWMGGGREGDVRRIVDGLVSAGKVAPMLVAGPSSVVRSQVAKGASWNHFDLDRFIDQTRARLDGVARIDERRILVAGHSGAGCSTAGGLATVSESKRKLYAILSIDTCMAPAIAQRLAESDAKTHVVVTYQRATWAKRPFRVFERTFERAVKTHPAADGVLRTVAELHPEEAPHDRCVPMTLRRWLPRLLPPPKKR